MGKKIGKSAKKRSNQLSKKRGNPKGSSGSKKEETMGKRKSGGLTKEQLDHKTTQSNANKGTRGTNKIYDYVHGNRGKQMNRKNTDQRK